MSTLLRTSLFALFVTSATLSAKPSALSDAVSAEERAAVVARLGELLAERYVFADVGEDCAAHLRAELAAGRFDDATSPEAFAALLTEQVQQISHDKHMRIQARAPERTRIEREKPAQAMAQAMTRERAANFGFERVEHLDGNIGYLDMRYFSGAREAQATAAAAMNFVANVDALVFDMRKNGGGDPEMIRYLSSWLFAEPTHLNSLYWRQGDRTDEFWTLEEVPGPRLPDVPVFVLTSDYTFSGAEEFSYNLQTQQRGTLVGETTGGGANPGGLVPINDRFGVFVPIGRAINPITGTNWEGTGVTPDVAVDAERAYDTGLQLARKAAEEHRAQRAAAHKAAWSDYADGQARAEVLLAEGNDEAAAAALASTLAVARSADLIAEQDINMLGYDHLGRGQMALAVAAFRFNVEAYPESSNVYDSLAEAYMVSGRNELAIEFYRKSVALDPGNVNAVMHVERLSAELEG